MGIYPDEKYETQPNGVLLHRSSTPGLERVAVYVQIAYIENRTNCYCCSCPEDGSDPACRNHGFAAVRPCEDHDMPGQPWGDEMGADWRGTMPESVQALRARRQRAETTNIVRDAGRYLP